MAYDNLLAEQPWSFPAAFSDAWISDIYTRSETDLLTKALQKSIAADSCDANAFPAGLMAEPMIAPIQTPTASGGSEREAATISKQRRGGPPTGRIAKRKSSRTSKRTSTTFVAVDPENFRQMVQQVTGVKFSGLYGEPPVVKPEVHRVVRGLQHGNVLDTSSFFVNGLGSSTLAPSPPPFPALSDGGVTGYDNFCSFPTLESYVGRE